MDVFNAVYNAITLFYIFYYPYLYLRYFIISYKHIKIMFLIISSHTASIFSHFRSAFHLIALITYFDLLFDPSIILFAACILYDLSSLLVTSSILLFIAGRLFVAPPSASPLITGLIFFYSRNDFDLF